MSDSIGRAEPSNSSFIHDRDAKPAIMDPATRWAPIEGEKKTTAPPMARGSLGMTEHIEHVEEEPREPNAIKRWWKAWWRHFRRWWCCYGLAGLIFLIIFLPVLFLVIVPAIAQLIVNKSNLPLIAGSIVDPTPEGVTFAITTALNVPKPFTVGLDETILFLYNNDTDPRAQYSSVTLPPQKLKGNATVIVEDQFAKIDNMDEFKKFLTRAFNDERVALSVFGNSTARIGALKAHINLDKTLEINGLDKLRGFALQKARLLVPPEADGTNIIGDVLIPNHSVITLGLGNITLDMFSDNLRLGSGDILNVEAVPGNNTFPFRGTLNIALVLQNLAQILEFQGPFLRNGNLQVGASGNKTTYNGVRIEYLEYVLNNARLTTEVPIVQIIADTLQPFADSNPTLVNTLLTVLTTAGSGLGALLSNLGNLGLTSLLGDSNINALLTPSQVKRMDTALQDVDVASIASSVMDRIEKRRLERRTMLER